MRLLTVSHFYASHGGGIERVAGRLCDELAAAGHEVAWSASSLDPAPKSPGVATLPLACVDPLEMATGLPMPLPGPRSIIALVRAVRDADAIIIHDALYVTSIVALLAARWWNKPALLIQHIAEMQFANPAMRFLMKIATACVTRSMLQAATRVVFISARVREQFVETRLRAPAQLLFNGVETSVFHADASETEAADFRSRRGLPSDARLIAFVGRFVAKKGLAIVREVAAARSDLVFVLAGTGPIEPTTWQLANVHVLGSLAPPEVAQLMRCADWLLLPSTGEGYPLVVQEALACGLPVICGPESASADPAAAGWLQSVQIDHARPSPTAAAIVRILDETTIDRESRTAMSDYAALTYCWRGMAEAIAGMFDDEAIRHPAARAVL